MINLQITTAAIEFIRKSSSQTKSDNLGLRIAVYPDNENQCYNYGIGFDEPRDNDITVEVKGEKILILDSQEDKLDNATLDYTEVNGELSLIVLNPNDPSYTPPIKEKKK